MPQCPKCHHRWEEPAARKREPENRQPPVPSGCFLAADEEGSLIFRPLPREKAEELFFGR